MNQVFGSHFLPCLLGWSCFVSSFLRGCLTSCSMSLPSLLPFVLCVYHFLRSCRVSHCLWHLHVCLQSLQLVFDLYCLLLCYVCLCACLCPCSILGLKPISYSVWASGLSLLCVRPQAHPRFVLGPRPIMFSFLCDCMLCYICVSPMLLCSSFCYLL